MTANLIRQLSRLKQALMADFHMGHLDSPRVDPLEDVAVPGLSYIGESITRLRSISLSGGFAQRDDLYLW